MKECKLSRRTFVSFLFALALVCAAFALKPVQAEAATTVKQVTGVTTTVKSTSSVKISWEKVSSATGYQVYRKVGSSGTWKKVKTTSSTSYTASKLSTGKTYYYKVRAYKKTSSSTVKGKFSSSVKYTGGTPAKVTGLTATAGVDAEITLSWDKVSGASGYIIYYKKSGGEWKKMDTVTSSSTTTYTKSGLSNGTKYSFKVCAYKKSNGNTYKGKCSSSVSKTAANFPKVTGVKATKSAATGITVSWTEIPGSHGYQVYRKASGGSWKKVATIDSSSTTTYTDTDLTFGTKYSYKVRGIVYVYGSSGLTTRKGSFSSSVSKTSTYIPSVSGKKVTQVSSTSAKVSWSKVSGASGYKIYRKTSSGGSWKLVKTIKSGSTTSWTNTGLTTGKKYYYTVKAYRTSGSKTYTGSYKGYCSLTLAYDYEVVPLADVYSGEIAVLYIKTDNEGDISVSIYDSDGNKASTTNIVMAKFGDIEYTGASNITAQLNAVDGGFIYTVKFNESGTYTFVVTEDSSGNSVSATGSVTVKDYDTYQTKYMKSVVDAVTDSSMTNAEKMAAIASYMFSVLSYPANYENESGTLYLANLFAEASLPWYASLVADSYTSPYLLLEFADYIGYENCEWITSDTSNYLHNYIICNDDGKKYTCTPLTSTGYLSGVTSKDDIEKIDLSQY